MGFFLQTFQNFLSELLDSARDKRSRNIRQARTGGVVVRVSGVMPVAGPMLEYRQNFMRWILCSLLLPTWRTMCPCLSRLLR
ncbi:hypothetical protein EMIT0347P_10569 [Pseudomonas sp. IT-347P]